MRDEAESDYAWLFRAQFRSLARAVNVIVFDRAIAEEIVQEAFVLLWRHWSKVSRYDRPDAWVRTVAIRLAVRTARRDRARRRLEQHVDRVPDPPSPDRALTEAVRALSPQQRAVVVLFYLNDRPVAEIAKTLRVSQSTVKQHLMRARQRLAATLSEEENDHVGG